MTSIDELLTAAESDVARGRTPACQVAVGHDGEVVAFETFGDARPSTRFAIFSATKPMVAAAVWHLIADGLLDVGRPVAEYVPEFATNGKAGVTVEQVMLHTSGFPNAPMTDLEGADPVRRRERFAEWQLEWEPGSRFEYHATVAHWVLADLLERLTGSDFRAVVAERVFSPLGLPRALGIPPDDEDDLATLTPVGDAPLDDFAFAYNRSDIRAAGNPGGGAFMTAADLAGFYQAVMRNPGGLWDPAVLEDVTTRIRCTFPDPLMGAPVNRSLGLVIAGDDGQHILRYAIFGEHVSPAAFGHAGAHAQVGWADPATGVSFAYVHSGVGGDQLASGARAMRLASIASALAL
jgi:CubicO group peptidase (beta-lactamase class C family)